MPFSPCRFAVEGKMMSSFVSVLVAGKHSSQAELVGWLDFVFPETVLSGNGTGN